MGLDVYVLEPIVPSPEDLATIESRHKFCEEHGCEPHFIIEQKELEKLSKTSWLISWNEQLIDWRKSFEESGKNMDEWELYRTDFKNDHSIYRFIMKDFIGIQKPTDEEQFVLDESNIKTKIENVTGVWLKNEELGYQRKGANQAFYDAGKWETDTIVVTKEELEFDWKKYFDSSQSFKENIIDRFIEGKNIVVYW